MTQDADGASCDPVAVPLQRLERRVVAYWMVTSVVRSLAMAVMLVVAARLGQEDASFPAWTEDLALALAALLVLVSVVAAPWMYATWRYAADDRLLTMRHGMLFIEDRRIPVPRMQHVDIMRGPIERMFGLATLVVFTAGNEGSAFRVPGLSIARAESLRDGILRARGRDVV